VLQQHYRSPNAGLKGSSLPTAYRSQRLLLDGWLQVWPPNLSLPPSTSVNTDYEKGDVFDQGPFCPGQCVIGFGDNALITSKNYAHQFAYFLIGSR
jgi:hypothetical protein